MNATTPSLSDLFGQLGLASDSAAIDRFIERHRPLDSSTHIQDAPFWSEAQASFIQGSLVEDAEWAEVIDQLNMRLR
ncbi:DUF2789 domain-containing protein [Aestuariibacter halophilus]|uniref:DUF2789 domain-containing protein n=1 Tax=Fluctibacter halophilus TaxID=226011 RepID=A0ABS8G2W4_9ALTE|nr:DUF2789 domain-containing protein [Aestuariibacter halophilus]MCC2614839.1 DUF2789 domain-containing protein [Aestuariibacter halophilus]